MIGNPGELVENFNNYFTDIAPNICKTLPQLGDYSIPKFSFPNSIFMFDVDEAELVVGVNSLKNINARGYDDISLSVIKKSLPIIAPHICHIMNCAFKNGIFPDSLKIAVISPLYKSGDYDSLENYRPISSLSSFAKIFEKILSNRLLNFFGKFKILNDCQHGFIRNKGTETALYDLTRAIIWSLESGEVPMGLFLDLSKAFDCVDHTTLLGKMEQCGIRNNQLELIRSYLSGRRQRTALNIDGTTYVSGERQLLMGVPQGSILGPLLFVVYINDFAGLFDFTRTHLVMYADDTNILIKNTNIPLSIESTKEILNCVSQWFAHNKLALNVKKTECIMFSPRSRDFSTQALYYNDVEVKFSSCSKFLGVLLDAQLKWEEHTEYVLKRLCSVDYSLKVVKKQVGENILKIIYYANAQSIMSYGIICWGSTNLRSIFVVQKRILRNIFGLAYRESCRGIFKKNNILTIYGLYIFRLLLFFHKNQHLYSSYKNTNNSRRLEPYFYPKHSLSLTEKHPEYAALKLFNALPRALHLISVHKEFKKLVYKLILDCEPYNMEEYFDFCNR